LISTEQDPVSLFIGEGGKDHPKDSAEKVTQVFFLPISEKMPLQVILRSL
jgi:hypothetical protein